MKKLKIITLIVISTIFTSCMTNVIPLNTQFYSSKKVGVIITIDSIGIAKAGNQGLLDMALTTGSRFHEPLKMVEKQLICKEPLKEEIIKALKAKNKPAEYLDLKMNIFSIGKFETKDKTKKFASLDYKKLKKTYQVDEILHIKVKYGILISYSGVIEVGKEGFCETNTIIVDLDDNSLMKQEQLKYSYPIQGNWKKGDNYSNLKAAIQNSISGAITQLKLKFI